MACLSHPELSPEQRHREAVVLWMQTGHQREGEETGAVSSKWEQPRRGGEERQSIDQAAQPTEIKHGCFKDWPCFKSRKVWKSLFDGNGEEIRPCFQSNVFFLSPSIECSFLNRLWLSFPECSGSSWPEVLYVLAEIKQDECNCGMAGERGRAGTHHVLCALFLCHLKK